MIKTAPPESASEGTTAGSENERSRGVIDSIKLLLESLPPQDRERAIQEISETLRPFPAAKAERVLGKILQFPTNKPWTVEELKSKIAESGMDQKPKELYNTITYLARKGHIKRVGYGRYIVDGVAMDTLDEFGGPNSRNEFEHRSRDGATKGGEGK